MPKFSQTILEAVVKKSVEVAIPGVAGAAFGLWARYGTKWPLPGVVLASITVFAFGLWGLASLRRLIEQRDGAASRVGANGADAHAILAQGVVDELRHMHEVNRSLTELRQLEQSQRENAERALETRRQAWLEREAELKANLDRYETAVNEAIRLMQETQKEADRRGETLRRIATAAHRRTSGKGLLGFASGEGDALTDDRRVVEIRKLLDEHYGPSLPSGEIVAAFESIGVKRFTPKALPQVTEAEEQKEKTT
jgi:hypothetical protein